MAGRRWTMRFSRGQVMQLRTVDGQLSLGSVFKLVAVGWLLSFGLLFAVALLFVLGITLVVGEAPVNGETVRGRVAILGAMAPLLIAFPVVIPVQAAMIGAFVTSGVAIYRKRRPITVVEYRKAEA